MKGRMDRSRGIEILIAIFFCKKYLPKCTRSAARDSSPHQLEPVSITLTGIVSIYERAYPFTSVYAHPAEDSPGSGSRVVTRDKFDLLSIQYIYI
jgi:hypothetical protein